MKYLIWLLVVLLGYGWWRSKTRQKMRQNRPPNLVANPTVATAPAVPQAMVACAHCGLHLPRSEALTQEQEGADYYCCFEHQQRHVCP